MSTAVSVAPSGDTPVMVMKRKRARVEKWDSYIHKMMQKQYAHIVPEAKGRSQLTIDRRTMRLFNSLVEHTLSILIEEIRRFLVLSDAVNVTQRATLNERDVYFAAKAALPPIGAVDETKGENDLYKGAYTHAIWAVENYNKYKPVPSGKPLVAKQPRPPMVTVGGELPKKKKKKPSTKIMMPRIQAKPKRKPSINKGTTLPPKKKTPIKKKMNPTTVPTPSATMMEVSV